MLGLIVQTRSPKLAEFLTSNPSNYLAFTTLGAFATLGIRTPSGVVHAWAIATIKTQEKRP